MAWLVMNNQYYIVVNTYGKVQPIDDVTKASVFETKKQAEEALRNTSKAFKKLGYRVAPTNQPVNVLMTKKKKKSAEQKPEEADQLLDAQYYVSELHRFKQFIDTVVSGQAQMEEKQIQAEQEVEDILHAAEFYELDQKQGYELYLKLRDARIRRRQYKDAAAWISLILMADPDTFLKKNPVDRIAKWEDRLYRPRALPELFQKPQVKE